MNVLYLSYDGMTDPLGQSQVLPYLKGLAKRHSITLISFEKKERSQNLDAVLQQVKESNIKWLPLEYHRKPPVFSTLKDVYTLWRKVLLLHKTNPFQLVHCRSYVTALVGLRLKRKFGVPFLFDMRGFWADERVEGGLWNLRNPLYRIIYNKFKAWEKEFIKHADAVITLTHAAQKEILSWNLNRNIHIIPCCVDEDLFNPDKIDLQSKQKLQASLGIEQSDFVLCYVGSLGTWYLMDEMMEFYSSLREKFASSKFLILTSEAPDFSMLEWKKEIITRSVRREEMPLYLSLSNASVFFIKPSFSKKGSSATKMAELMAMNVPFVTNDGWGDVREILSKGSGGLLVSQLNKVDYEEAIQTLTQRSLPPSRSLVTNYFSLSYGIQLYGQLYASLEKKNF
ncbi:MAG: glycosyltransferase [Cyclobacteriaceae bacterium]|nr:glycosyltransferase [Cyclobacteriaceae bacterium]